VKYNSLPFARGYLVVFCRTNHQCLRGLCLLVDPLLPGILWCICLCLLFSRNGSLVRRSNNSFIHC